MSKKLLDKTLRAYILYAVLILLIAAPIFYYATQRLYINEADDTLLLHKKEFIKNTAPTLQYQDIAIWNHYNRNIKIDSLKKVANEILFFTTYHDTLDDELEPYRELNFPITIAGRPYTYVEKINLVETDDLLKNIAILFFVIISLLLVGLFFITKRLSQKLWSPFYKILEQIESFEIDKIKHPAFTKTDIEEFARLQSSILKLMEKNTIIYNNQKEFIENAAHELQTPLAVFQAKIDTIIQRSDITQAQSEILNALNEQVSRLNRLNRNLLLLSKIENDPYDEKQPIVVAAYINKNLDFFTEQAEAKQLTIQLDLHEDLVIQSNPVLAEILISNLFLNAIKHNIEGGIIAIAITAKQLVISNSSSDSALHTSKLFNRFSKTNPSKEGTGLGLSIIKKIADINHWTVTYQYKNGFHSFSIIF